MRVLVCKRCGAKLYPPRYLCWCGSREFEIGSHEEIGKVVIHTKIFVTPKGFPSPITVGLVELAPGLKVLARLNAEENELLDGVKVLEDVESLVAVPLCSRDGKAREEKE